ncbi:hypothetical protein UlMin_042344 [Ulmus minor]
MLLFIELVLVISTCVTSTPRILIHFIRYFSETQLLKVISCHKKILDHISSSKEKHSFRMPRQYQLISEINPQSRLWIAKVYVEDKGMPRSSPNSPAKYQRRDDQTMTRSPQTPSKYQRLTLVDPTGTKIQATIFPNDIPLFKDTLVVDKSYYISNATVSEIPLKYRSANNMFQWTINKRTLVEPVIEDNEVISIPTPTLIPFSELKEYINSAQSIDVIGIALDMNPIKEVHTPYGSQKVQEVILIDQGFTVIILTLWEQFLECESLAIMEKISTNPVILAKKLKVTPYNGLSLSMRQSTTFIINPAIPQAASLKKWSKENKKVLDQIRIEKTYKASSSNMALPASKDIIKIKDIKNLHEKEMTSWLKGKIMVTNINQKFWFMACNKCHKAQGANYNQVFKCFRCREARAIGLPRCCVEVQVMDESGSITATLFGENAEKVLSCTAKNLMENTSNLHYEIFFYIRKKTCDFKLLHITLYCHCHNFE